MLSRVERGERELSTRLRVAMSRRLGVRVRDLFEPQPFEDEPDAAAG
jgi:hypothetical protein